MFIYNVLLYLKSEILILITVKPLNEVIMSSQGIIVLSEVNWGEKPSYCGDGILRGESATLGLVTADNQEVHSGLSEIVISDKILGDVCLKFFIDISS